jgi:F-type H+-transporting ATPase subunit delta
MSSGAVAERYAQAVFELARDDGSLAELAREIADFAKMVEGDEQLRSVLLNPLLPHDQRRALISSVAERSGVSPLGVRSLLVIALRGRLASLSEISARLEQLVDEQQGVVRASVITAQEMPESYFQALLADLQGATDKKVVLERSVDASLIAGAIAQVGDSVLDASVRGRLQQLERDTLLALSAGTT